MESLRIDRTKLITVTNYAAKYGMTRQNVYIKAKKGEVNIIEIDRVKFVKLK